MASFFEKLILVLQVYSSGVILGTYCSDDIPPLLTSTRELTIYFHSDVSTHASGFMANYTLFDKKGEYRILTYFPTQLIYNQIVLFVKRENFISQPLFPS